MIYADNAATAKLSLRAWEAMLPYLQEQYGNPSSLCSIGVKARKAVEAARKSIASSINAAPEEIYFTSSGTEGNNWVISNYERSSIVTSTIEHPSVLNVCGATALRVPVDRKGRVQASYLLNTLRPDTRLVSIMLANNEIGSIQPIAEIAHALTGKNIRLHTDAVQAVGHIPIDVKALGVDYLTASAHKFGGPKGVGFLYAKEPLPPMMAGGGQERGYRAGTENVAGIVGMAAALEESLTEMDEIAARLKSYVALTIQAIREYIPNTLFNGNPDDALPGFVNIYLPGASGEAIVHLLDLKGICVSTGSACHSGKDEPSYVLLALGLTEQQAKSSIRISYGRYNTEKDVNEIVSAIRKAHEKIIATKATERS